MTVTESAFQHEREGLEFVKNGLPDAAPYRAWSNFTFTANTGHVREVDLLVACPSGLYLIELKDWHGRLETAGSGWVQHTPSGHERSHTNAVHLANQKAKELRGLLQDALNRSGGRARAPYVSEAVFLTSPSLNVRLSTNDVLKLYGKDGSTQAGTPLQGILDLLTGPGGGRGAIDVAMSNKLPDLLNQIGIGRSAAEYEVGSYQLKPRPFDTGENWADYLASHKSLRKLRRVRIYLRERNADKSLRESVNRVAEREAKVLQGILHPGLVQLEDYSENGHPAGPALIYGYHPETLRLDEYMARYGERLDMLTRSHLLRQIAETIRFAHGRRAFHRTLCARAIHVIPGPRGKGSRSEGSDEESWLAPRIQISEWQTAVRRFTAGSTAVATGRRGITKDLEAVPSHQELSIDTAAEAYLAPELTARDPDPIALDVFGLGTLAYLLFTGKPPAASQAELIGRLAGESGLSPSSAVDGLPDDVDLLVQCATAYDPLRRVRTVDEILELLDDIDDRLTAPEAVAEPAQEDPDPLEAVKGTLLADRFLVERQLGMGSTSKALLAKDTSRDGALVVLKVARSSKYEAALRREADVLGKLRNDSRIIRLAVPNPIELGRRTTLVLEHAGEKTVARQLREDGRLLTDQLELYGDYLFSAVDFLESEGVWHRDVKPDNIAIRVMSNETKRLVLFDFSLAGYPVEQIKAGTEGYLDPFLGSLKRPHYDPHAERYAVAVTLHEMASGELPEWGSGKVDPKQTDPEQEPYPKIASEAFDASIRDGLTRFFRRALHRDTAERYPDFKAMSDDWKRVFLLADQPVARRGSGGHTLHPQTATTSEKVAAAELGELPHSAQAEEVTAETALLTSGLSQRASSFLAGLGLTTVGELLGYASPGRLVNKPGLGARTRDEINARMKHWRLLLNATEPRDTPEPAPLSPENRSVAEAEFKQALRDQSPDALRILSLDVLVGRLVPLLDDKGGNATEVEATRLLLGLPDERGTRPRGLSAWPRNVEVAVAVGVSGGRVAQILGKQRKLWAKDKAIRELRAELVELLSDLGRVASATELAGLLIRRRGTMQNAEGVRQAMALAAVRAAYEADWQGDTRRFGLRQHGEAGAQITLIALEVDEDNDPADTPPGPALLDLADRLGKAADGLAARDALAAPTTVLEELAAAMTGFVESARGCPVVLTESRLVTLSTAASRDAASNARYEIYPRDLEPVRALRLSQAGLVVRGAKNSKSNEPGLTAKTVQDRVAARFPGLTTRLPEKSTDLANLLNQAGFDVEQKTLKNGDVVFVARAGDVNGTDTFRSGHYATALRSPSRPREDQWTANDPARAAAHRTDAQLTEAKQSGGFRALTVKVASYNLARQALATRYDAHEVNVAALFLQALHARVDSRPKPTWETILTAASAELGSRAAVKFAEYAASAWSDVEPVLASVADGNLGRPVLLADAEVLARFGGFGLLGRLIERSESGGGALWLLCPAEDAGNPPRLHTEIVRVQAGSGWIKLMDEWATNKHRGADGAVGVENETVGGRDK
ncbi:BREX system serine/threonine kinase PglW [Actinospica robiniae]|uniref:BREX system serine/threonine kinase PglW n=1 Tax=Actinospica robiniae TaxID=304901 RepID=UPI000409D8D0|nr:BREX system serine/threonine kinase PglW [Actinospica robiniae]